MAEYNSSLHVKRAQEKREAQERRREEAKEMTEELIDMARGGSINRGSTDSSFKGKSDARLESEAAARGKSRLTSLLAKQQEYRPKKG